MIWLLCKYSSPSTNCANHLRTWSSDRPFFDCEDPPVPPAARVASIQRVCLSPPSQKDGTRKSAE